MKKGVILSLILLFSLTSCSLSNETNSTSEESSLDTTTSITSSQESSSISSEDTTSILPVYSDTKITFANIEDSLLASSDLNLSNDVFEITSLDSANITLNNGQIIFDVSSYNYLSFSLDKQVFLSSIYLNGYSNREEGTSELTLYMDGRVYTSTIDYYGNTVILNFENPILIDNFKIEVTGCDLYLDNMLFKYSGEEIVNATSFTLKENVDLELSNKMTYNLLNYVDIFPKSTSSYKIEVTSENKNFVFKNNFISFFAEQDYTIYLNLVGSDLSPIRIDLSIIGNYYRLDSNEIKFSTYDSSVGYKSPTLQTIGDINVLLVPVEFEKGNSNYDIRDFSQQDLKNLDIAFNGNPNDINTSSLWNSVSSYYYQSSFGKLDLNFVMSDPFTPSFTAKDFEGMQAGICVNSLISDIEQKGLTIDNIEINFKDFDQNNDGWVDAVWFVYNNFSSIYTSGFSNSNYWAYVSNTFSNSNKEQPKINKYANAGYAFQLENANGYEAHTYIHETGHLLGSSDYYNNSGRGALGNYDMMAYNLGDHNAYTKFLYNWVSPYVVTGNCQIEISPSYMNGDCIILPTTKGEFSNAPYDEYLMIEYYYPGGLETQDAQYGYNGYGYKFNNNGNLEYGIRIYHIDARLIKMYINPIENSSAISYSFAIDGNNLVYFDPSSNNTITTNEYSGSGDEIIYETYYLYNSNVSINNDPKNYREIQALTRNYTTLEGTYFNECEALFKAGDTLDSNRCDQFFSNNLFNNGNKLNFSIKIESLTAEKAVISFSL